MRPTTLRLVAVAAAALLLIAAARPIAAGSGYAVVVHADSKVRAVSRPLLSSIFLKQRANWEDGSRRLATGRARTSSGRTIASAANVTGS